ncbi:MAG: segregation/condensation protein A, partial [Synergistaceae bacterium]|nr:segregation/condensation protein A [Synergistaceae bacterium]
MPETVEVAIEGFSGPFDLLCRLVESRQMQASKIKVAQLVRIYGAYLAQTKKASVEALIEFFYQAAGLLLQKTLSLLPAAPEDFAPEEDGELPITEEELMERLARYRPYRSATAWLEERKARQDRCFRRLPPDDDAQTDPVYDIGDLYFLSRVWWGLIDRASAKKKLRTDFDWREETWDGMPEALPEESQIQSRIEELEEKLAGAPT